MASKIAFIFPGQGSQVPGMGKSLYEASAAAREVYSACAATRGGENIAEVSWNGTREDLTPTNIAQPAIFAASVAAANALAERGIVADGAAGFSLGEISALCFSGFVSLKDAFALVNFRAEKMHECTQKNHGGMAAILGLSEEAVIAACEKIPDAWPVNFNAPKQIVVAFDAAAAERLTAEISGAGGKVLPLAVAGAFHSPHMNAAAAELESYLGSVRFQDAAMPLFSNATAEKYSREAARKLLSTQVNSPVLWQKTIENMLADGYDTFIECGPGKTLTGMVKKISKDAKTFNVHDAESLEKCINEV